MANIKGNITDAPESGTPENDELLVRAANMNIKQYVPVEKAGEYDEQVDTLIQVDAETGYQNSIEILVPTDQVKKHKGAFSKSARKRDRTARIVNGELGVEQTDGTLLEFVLTPKVHRKPNAPKETDETGADTPEKVA